MPLFINPDPVYTAKLVAVGAVQQTVLPSTDIRGEDNVLLVVQNNSATETFTGVVSSSPDGVTQWIDELNDEFASIAPSTTRRMVVASDRLWIRLLGNFGAAPDTVRITLVRLRKYYRRG